ncbi:arsenic metallochaperone ArsD family protein [Klebsiella aerogenes]
MSKIEIFEAAGCCATSSVVVSDEAVKWNASAEWAKKNGVDIQRYSLANNPQQFLNSPVIKEFLNTSGMESLPFTLLDGKLVMAGKLPTREDIARWAGIPLSQDWSEDSTQPRCCSIPRMPSFQRSNH